MVDLPEPPPMLQTANKLVWEQTFGGKFEDRRYAIGVFKRHNVEVKKRVPPERLLVYEVKEGWGPLCEFLGVAIPKDKPFPHLNDTEDFRQRSSNGGSKGTKIPT
jgi:Sulfotransferase domain